MIASPDKKKTRKKKEKQKKKRKKEGELETPNKTQKAKRGNEESGSQLIKREWHGETRERRSCEVAIATTTKMSVSMP